MACKTFTERFNFDQLSHALFKANRLTWDFENKRMMSEIYINNIYFLRVRCMNFVQHSRSWCKNLSTTLHCHFHWSALIIGISDDLGSVNHICFDFFFRWNILSVTQRLWSEKVSYFSNVLYGWWKAKNNFWWLDCIIFVMDFNFNSKKCSVYT